MCCHGSKNLIVASSQTKRDSALLNYERDSTSSAGAAISPLPVCVEPYGLPTTGGLHCFHLPFQLYCHWNKSECHTHCDGERGRLETFKHIFAVQLDHVQDLSGGRDARWGD